MGRVYIYFAGDEDDPFKAINTRLDNITKEAHTVALDQATFDVELGELVTAVTQLLTTVESMASAVDLTAEGQAVSDAAAAVKAELDKLNPSTSPSPVTPPTDVSAGADVGGSGTEPTDPAAPPA